MHPRSPYAEAPPDFAALAEAHPPLRAFCRAAAPGSAHSLTIDWRDQAALAALAAALLRRDFGISWELPVGHLCPTVPSRLNYLLWLEDLLGGPPAAAIAPAPDAPPPPRARPVRGLDVGTGASCIYPLLGHAHLGWAFVGTDIDPDSLRAARANVARNGWEAAIEIRDARAPAADAARAAAESRPLVGVVRADEAFDFVMCNPPFYASAADAALRPNPHTAREATAGELVTAGGEFGFVRRLLADSLALRGRVAWFSSLLGKKASLDALLAELRARRARPAEAPVAVRSGALAQGGTTRWVVAWTYDDDAAARAPGEADARGARAAPGARTAARKRPAGAEPTACSFAPAAPSERARDAPPPQPPPPPPGMDAAVVAERVREALAAFAADAATEPPRARLLTSVVERRGAAGGCEFCVAGAASDGAWRALVAVRAPAVGGGAGARVEVLALPFERDEGPLPAAPAPSAADEPRPRRCASAASGRRASDGASLAARVDLAARLRAAVERRGRKWRRLEQQQTCRLGQAAVQAPSADE